MKKRASVQLTVDDNLAEKRRTDIKQQRKCKEKV